MTAQRVLSTNQISLLTGELITTRTQFIIDKILSLWYAFKLLVGPVLFMFLYSCMPTAEDAFYTYLYDTYFEFMVNIRKMRIYV